MNERSEYVANEALSVRVIMAESRSTLFGPFCVFAVRADKVIAQRTGIASVERCRDAAIEYSRWYGAPPAAEMFPAVQS